MQYKKIQIIKRIQSKPLLKDIANCCAAAVVTTTISSHVGSGELRNIYKKTAMLRHTHIMPSIQLPLLLSLLQSNKVLWHKEIVQMKFTSEVRVSEYAQMELHCNLSTGIKSQIIYDDDDEYNQK